MWLGNICYLNNILLNIKKIMTNSQGSDKMQVTCVLMGKLIFKWLDRSHCTYEYKEEMCGVKTQTIADSYYKNLVNIFLQTTTLDKKHCLHLHLYMTNICYKNVMCIINMFCYSVTWLTWSNWTYLWPLVQICNGRQYTM